MSQDREPLPLRVDGLPSLPPEALAILAEGLAMLGLDDLSEPVVGGLVDHLRLLLAWNQSVNLSAIRAAEAAVREHILDSLTAVHALRERGLDAVLDLGSGGGYPGLPLAVVLPAGVGVLIESVGKKARFLDVAVAAVRRALGPDGDPPVLEVDTRRAESLAGLAGRRGAFDLVTVRAVGPLDRLAALGLPLLRPGGLLVAWKSDDGSGALQAEIRAAGAAIAGLGAAPARIAMLPSGVAGLDGHRLVVVRAGSPRPPAKGRTRLLG